MSTELKNSRTKDGSVKSSGSKPEDKGLTVVDERIEPVHYMPLPMVQFYQDAVNDMIENPTKFNESDQSEIWERLGVAQYFFGVYRQSTASLQAAFDLRKKLKYTRASARVALLLGTCHYRVGLLDLSLNMLENVVKNAAKNYPDLCAIAYGNLALVYMSTNKMKEAVENGKKGLELMLKVAKGEKSAERVLQLTRILINAYMKINDLAKAEVLVFTFGFPKFEMILLKAGVKFAGGNIEDANNLIDMYLDEKAAEDAAEKTRLDEEQRKAASQVSLIPSGELPPASQPDDDAGSVGGGSVGSLGSMSTKNSQSKRKIASGKGRADDQRAYDNSSYHSGVLSDEEDEEQEDNKSVPPELDTRTQQEKWADQDRKEAEAKEKSEIEQRTAALTAYKDHKKKLDALLTEAKCIYNLSVLASRQYALKKVLQMLDSAENVINIYLALQKSYRAACNTDEPQAMKQYFMDADLNHIPLCQQMDDMSEPYIVLSHIFSAKADAHVLLANQSKHVAFKVTAGSILNRALPTVSNGNDFDPDDPKRSQVYDEAYIDNHILLARENAAKSVSILNQSQLSQDIMTLESTRETEKDPLAAKKFDADGNEIVEPVVMERVTTTLKPVDLSIATSEQDAISSQIDMLMGPTGFKKAADNAVKELKLQYGVKLTERGTKSHQNSRVDYKTQYVSTFHDPVSIRAELMPLVSKVGRDDIALWVEWCLSASGGLGMGMFGTSFQMPINKAQQQKEMADKMMAEIGGGSTTSVGGSDEASVQSAISKSESIFKTLDSSTTIGNNSTFPALKPAARPGEAFLKEVRSRLTEVENLLSSRFDQSETLYKPRDKELRILVNICLARVTAQLKQKRDCELAIDMLEELAKDMKHRTQNSQDGYYVALACRYRLEIEEAKVPSGMSTEAMANKLIELLAVAKAYVAAAERCALSAEDRKKSGELGPDQSTADIMLRDAYKKCINLYVDLASSPVPEQDAKNKAKMIEEKGTLEMLSNFAKEEIDDIEASGDTAWFRKYGKIRAQQLFAKLRACKGK